MDCMVAWESPQGTEVQSWSIYFKLGVHYGVHYESFFFQIKFTKDPTNTFYSTTQQPIKIKNKKHWPTC